MAMPEPSAGTAFLSGEGKPLCGGGRRQRPCRWLSSRLLPRERGQGPHYFADKGRQGRDKQERRELLRFSLRDGGVPVGERQSPGGAVSRPSPHLPPPQAAPLRAGNGGSHGSFPQGRPQKAVSLFPGLPAPGSIAPAGAQRLPGPPRLRPRRRAFSSSAFHPPPAALLSANP